MDYEFLRDLTGKIRAKFSMGHEVLGHWLNEEINSDIEKLDQIEEMAKQLQGNERQWRWVGHEYTLWLNAEEAIIRANPLYLDTAEFEEGMNYYDQESVCACGLEDFLAVLKDYRDFILALK